MATTESVQASLGQTFNSVPVLIVMSYIAMVASLLVNGMPVVVGTIGEAYDLQNEQLGVLASAFLAGKFLMVCTSMLWIRKVDWRKVSIVTFIISIALGFILLINSSYQAFILVFFLMGLSMACFYLPVFAFWSDVDDPTRAVSVGVLFQVIGAALFVYSLPNWITPRWGISGLVGFLLVALTIALCCSGLIPKAGRKLQEQVTEKTRVAGSNFSNIFLPVAGLLIMTVYYAGLFGMWAFLDRIGVARGLTSEATGSALSLSLLIGAGALVVSSMLGDRIGHIKPLFISLFLYACFFVLMFAPLTAASFSIACILFNLGWNFGLPYQLAIIAKADVEGRYFVLLLAFQAAGQAGGPYIAGILSNSGDYSQLYFLLIASIAISVVGYSLLAIRTGQGGSLNGIRLSTEKT